MSLSDTLNRSSSQATALVDRGRQTVEKRVQDFARLAVPSRRGGGILADKAGWKIDRNEYARRFTGSFYIAVSAIARRVASQEAVVQVRRMKKSGEQLIDVPPSHPLRELFNTVNPFHTQYDLWWYMVAWRLSMGDSYTWKARNGLGVPAELWPLPPQWVHAVPSPETFIESWRVSNFFASRKPEDLPPKDVVRVSETSLDWSGVGRFYGTPPAFAAGSDIDNEHEMLQRMRYHFKNLSPPGLHYETDEMLTEDQVFELYEQILAQHGTSRTTGSPIISHGGLKFKGDESKSVREMDYTKSLDTTLDRTLAVYATPRAAVGLSKEYNRANYLAAVQAWCEGSVNPMLTHSSQHLTQSFAEDYDEDLVVTLPHCHPSDSEFMLKKYESAMKNGATDPNEFRAEVLEKEPFKSGGSRPLLTNQTLAPFGNVKLKEEEEESSGLLQTVGGLTGLINLISAGGRGEVTGDQIEAVLTSVFGMGAADAKEIATGAEASGAIQPTGQVPPVVPDQEADETEAVKHVSREIRKLLDIRRAGVVAAIDRNGDG